MVVVVDVYFVCVFVHTLRLVDLQACVCVWSFASVTMLRADTVS